MVRRGSEATLMERLTKLPRAAWFLLIGTFAISLGSYMVVPYLAIYLTAHAGLSLATVGVAFTAKLWAQSGLGFFGGILSDRYGGKRVMVLGLLVRVVAYLGLAFAPAPGLVVMWSTLIGVGAALYAPAVRASIITLCADDERVFVFSLQNTALNAGLAIGPLIGVLLLPFPPMATFTLAAVMFAAFSVAFARLLPAFAARLGSKTFRLRDFAAIVANPPVWFYCLTITLFFVAYVQIEYTMPSYAQAHYTARAVGLLFIVNALVVIFVQLPVSRWSERAGTWFVVAASFVAMGAAFATIAIPGLGLAGFLVGIAVFSLGELLLVPKINAALTYRVPPQFTATALGLLSISAAIGGGLGHWLGGTLYVALGAASRSSVYWLAIGSALFALAALTFIPYVVERRTAASAATPSPSAGAA